ncbi:MAG: VWA domain-containing protein [Verrucomicrobiota bacterium]|nr:VWA domain-containing protein [Verrucomicrobiota bacterium]
MSFEDPVWLRITPILVLLFGGILAYGFRQRDALLGRFAASRLLDQLTEKASLTRAWIKAGCILLAVLAIGIAHARPQLGVEWSERKARGMDIVFILDSSKSMLATDLRPTRLDRAKLAIIDLIERLEGDRIGLIAFAGQAFLQTPPTLDYSAFRESLDAIDPSIMTSGGSDLGNAIDEATKAFPSQNNVKVVVLLTDGEDLSGNAASAATRAREDGIQVFTIGIGTPEGEYLRIRNEQGIEEFVRDSSGQPVLSKLDENTLQTIAQATGGIYSQLSSDSLDQLYNSVIARLPREERESELQEIGIERFQWALTLALIFLVFDILIRRRRSATIHAGMLILATLTLSPTDTIAETGSNPNAYSNYNAAYRALTQGDYEAAQAGYENVLSNTNDLNLQRDALYNLAHATYQQGHTSYESGDLQAALIQVEKAEALFQSAQEIDTSDTSIQADIDQVSRVREAIEKLIEQQQSQDNEEQSGESEENQDSSGEGEDSEDSQNSEQSETSEQGENSSKDQQNQENDSGEVSTEQSNQHQEGSEGGPSEESGDQKNQEATDEEGEGSSANDQESTEDPLDDIPQSQSGEESGESGDEEGQQAVATEATEGESQQDDQAGTMSSEVIEGMTEAEAAALLDSLRGKETLLPFNNQARGKRSSDSRDW